MRASASKAAAIGQRSKRPDYEEDTTSRLCRTPEWTSDMMTRERLIKNTYLYIHTHTTVSPPAHTQKNTRKFDVAPPPPIGRDDLALPFLWDCGMMDLRG